MVALDAMGAKAAEVQEPEFIMKLPQAETYIDLHDDSVIPVVTMPAVKNFYRSQDKPFEDKYTALYKER